MNIRFKDISKLKAGGGAINSKIDYMFLYGLISYIQPENIIEIGTNFGVSAIIMALALKENNVKGHIYTYDIGCQYQDIVMTQAKKLDVEDRITALVGTSDDVKNLPIKYFEFGFIDGNHSYKAVKKDFNNLNNICKYIIFHDTVNRIGVKKFFNEIAGEKVNIVKVYPNKSLGGFGMLILENKK